MDTKRQGLIDQGNSLASVWDIKYFNQTEPKNNYQTRQVVTRSSAEGYSAQTLKSYGPTTTPSNNVFQVSLTGGVPTFSWQFTAYDTTVIDSSSVSGKYARWTFDIVLGTNTAKNSLALEPGTRFTNTSGSFGIQHSHTLYYYKNLDSYAQGRTGIITRFYSDITST